MSDFTRTMPANLEKEMAETWAALAARADVNGVVTLEPGETVENLDVLEAIQGCTVDRSDPKVVKVTLMTANAPAAAEPAVASEEVRAAAKQTEFAGQDERREEEPRRE